jgi:hypothetical protein
VRTGGITPRASRAELRENRSITRAVLAADSPVLGTSLAVELVDDGLDQG